MAGTSGIDPTTLDWVSTETRTSLRDAQASLQIYQQSEAANPTALRVFANHLHQIVGILQMVEIDTLARLAGEAEQLAEAIADGPEGGDEGAEQGQTLELLSTAIAQIDAGLDRVERGESELPLHRATILNQLRLARGARQLEMYTMFSPDLEVFPPLINKSVIDDDEYRSAVKALRQKFQLSMLNWLRKTEEAGTEPLHDVVSELHELARFSDVVRLWWIALAYIDAIGLQSDDSTREHAQVFRQLDEKMYDLTTRGEQALIQGACDDLVRRMLYQIGMTARPDHTSSISEVFEAYDLQALFRSEDVEVPLAETDAVAQSLSRLGERVSIDMALVQQLLTRYFDEHGLKVDGLQPIVEQIKPVVEHADELGVGLLGELAQEVTSVIGFAEENDQASNDEELAFQLATALLYIDHSLSGELAPDDNWHQTLEARIAGLQSLRGEGEGDRTGHPGASVTDTERLQLLKIVEAEVSSTLSEIEEKLEVYEKDTSNVDRLAGVSSQFEDVRGVLLVAGEQKMGLLLSLAAEQSNLLYRQETEPTPALLEALAVTTGAAQAFVQGMHSRQTERDELLERAISDLERAAGMKVGRADVEELIDKSTQALNSWLNDVSDFAVLTQLRRHLRDILKLSSDTGLDSVVELVEEENQLLDLVAGEPTLLDPDVTATLKDSMACITELLIGLYGTEEADDVLEKAEQADEPGVPGEDDFLIHDGMDETVAASQGELSPEASLNEYSAEATSSGPEESPSPLHNEELRAVFLAEAFENLRVVKEWLDEAASDESGSEFPDLVYVSVHTLRGNFRALELIGIADAFAAADNLLARLAMEQQPLPEAGVQALSDLHHETAGILKDLESGQLPGSEGDETLEGITRALLDILGEQEGATAAAVADDVTVAGMQSAGTQGITDLLPEEVQLELTDGHIAGPVEEVADSGDIFCEDALRALERMKGLIPVAAGEAASPETLDKIVDELTTLKGSARVAGVEEIGDLAHAAESFLNTSRESGLDGTGDVSERLQQVFLSLESYIGCIRRGEQVHVDTELLAQLAGPLPANQVVSDIHSTPIPDDTDEFTRELVGVYCEEAQQVLTRIDQTLADWADSAGWVAAADALHRDLHTLKGGAAMAAGAEDMARLSHEAESLIDRYVPDSEERDRQLHRLLQELHDVLLADVHRLEADQTLDAHDGMFSRLGEFGEAGTSREAVSVPASGSPVAATDANDTGGGDRAPTMRIDVGTLDRLSNYAGDVSVSRSQMAEEMASLKETLERLRRSTSGLNEQLQNLELQADSGLLRDEPERHTSSGNKDDPGEFDALELDRYSGLQKLSRDLLESMDELGTIERTLNAYAHRVETSLQQQERVNKELQDQIMQVRMVPFGGIAPRLRHIARQAATQLNKEVELVVRGRDVELDRSVLEGVTEALEHMVRNAVDHGIEDPEERSAAGKPGLGRVEVECSQLGREILVQISDDGRGLAVEQLREAAMDQGFIQHGDTLGNDGLLALVSSAGFTSRDEVTRLSGRGIGMGVVNASLRRLGGSLELKDTGNSGTSFLLRLPVSLAIARAMYFRVGTHEYAAAMRAIERVINVEAARIEELREKENPVLEDRGESYAVIDLRDYLGHTRGPAREGTLPVLLVRAGTQNIAVVADEVTDNREIVIKPLGEHLASIPIYAGGTIRADGSVVLMLDIIGMAYTESTINVATPDGGESSSTPMVLVVDDSLTIRKAAQRDLAAYGIRVSTATDGVDAQRVLETRTPDLILLDIEMPRMDGYEFLEWLRGSDVKDLPVAVISSRSTDKYRKKAFDLGATDFLGKPYRVSELLEILRTRLGYEFEEGGMGDG